MLISISLTLENNRHVRVDIFYSKMSENHKRYIDIIAYLIFIIPLSILIIIKSTLFIINSFIQNEIFADPGGLAFRFLVKSLIVIGFSLLIIESIKKILNITK
jgi:TRAP-type mannitol/chloroaromatic compound transport system permease small subunit